MDHCPQIGKIYVLIIICLIFSSELIALCTENKENKTKEYGVGIFVTIVQVLFTLYMLYIDVFNSCSKLTTDKNMCGDGCKWYKISPNLYKCTKIDIIKGYIYIPILLLSSIYMLSFGIISINKSDTTEKNDTVSVISIIIGSVGLLYIIIDFVCGISCYCGVSMST